MMDSLVQLTQLDIAKLRDFYESHEVFAPQIRNFLHCVLKWGETHGTLITVHSPNGVWTPDGTFVAILEFNCYEIYMFTMDKYCKRLTYALQHTKQIDWTRAAIIYALHEDLQAPVIELLLKINVPISFIQDNNFWIKNSPNIPVTKCIENFYLAPLTKSHATSINQVWPYRYDGSEGYVRTLIEVNGGIGVFEEAEEDSLVAWILLNGAGLLGMLQTTTKNKRMGLATWAVQAMSEQMSAKNMTPMCTIAPNNIASQKTFSNCGFKWFAKCCFIGTGAGSTIAFDSDYDCGIH